jgi:hypothetical protein
MLTHIYDYCKWKADFQVFLQRNWDFVGATFFVTPTIYHASKLAIIEIFLINNAYRFMQNGAFYWEK